jgi:flagellar protein FliO/FliZ
MSGTVTFIFAFVVVLGLIGLAAWLVRRFASNRLGANTQRGRMPRLAVIDAAAVDGRRRLVLVRRDNVEHLLMIGGPTDIVVEPNILRAVAGREQLPHRPAGADAPPRISPLPDTSWNEDDAFSHLEPQMPEPPPRPARPAFAEEMRRPAPPPMPVPERRAEPPMPAFPPEPMGRPEPRAERELRPDPRESMPREPMPPRMPRGEPMPRSEAMPRSEPMPRGEPMPRSEPMMPRPQREMPKPPPMRAPAPERVIAAPPPPPPPPAPPAVSADQNLAEMAQRLEAALRRPAAPSTDAPPVAPEPPPPPARASRAEPPAPAAPKTSFENLEDEMASLLGRPNKSSS